MKIRELRMTFKENVQVEVWADCWTRDDCDALISWLQLAKQNISQWEKIRAKASRAAKAAPSKDENPQQGKVLSPAPVAVGTDGFNPSKATYPIGVSKSPGGV